MSKGEGADQEQEEQDQDIMFYLCVSTLQLVPLSSYRFFPPTCEQKEKQGEDQEKQEANQEKQGTYQEE